MRSVASVLYSWQYRSIPPRRVSGENDEAADGKRRVDADYYACDPRLDDTCGKKRDIPPRCLYCTPLAVASNVSHQAVAHGRANQQMVRNETDKAFSLVAQ
jgi:hypothetical protein